MYLSVPSPGLRVLFIDPSFIRTLSTSTTTTDFVILIYSGWLPVTLLLSKTSRYRDSRSRKFISLSMPFRPTPFSVHLTSQYPVFSFQSSSPVLTICDDTRIPSISGSPRIITIAIQTRPMEDKREEEVDRGTGSPNWLYLPQLLRWRKTEDNLNLVVTRNRIPLSLPYSLLPLTLIHKRGETYTESDTQWPEFQS